MKQLKISLPLGEELLIPVENVMQLLLDNIQKKIDTNIQFLTSAKENCMPYDTIEICCKDIIDSIKVHKRYSRCLVEVGYGYIAEVVDD